ncbi:MAG: sporulation protein YunB [Oscillospiraceae bacterium]|nr:sporulation protein YunB [Oscillospiraceae bacterium]
MRLQIKRRRTKRGKAGRRGVAVLLLLAGISVGIFSFFNMKTSPMLREVAQSELESIAFDIVGRTVEEELLRDGADYDDLVHIERNAVGDVSSITTDIKRLNLLKLRVVNRLSDEMFKRTEDAIKIPLGNLTGIDFLTGKGPDITFRTMWVSSVNGEYRNTFEAAGINQTCHRIMLDFTINVGMMFAGREIGTDVGLSVCVAETVIVGAVPDFFTGREYAG